ncbi:MAG: aminotransferase class I/II-fold pyridoxal phosphate-dependent enzyme [Aestuariivirga sp.]
MDDPRLDLDLSLPGAIPEEGIQRAIEVMRAGKLHRYGEDRTGVPEATALEQDYATYIGKKYCAALNSCGASMFVALKCVGVVHDDKVLMNAFTLAPVPGAVEHAGAQPVFVEIDENYKIDLNDLDKKAASSGAKVLLLSHMRGHICDMEALMVIAKRHGFTVIEDCAHTMGAKWNGKFTGTFGAIGCFSLQSFKHANAGEGGLLVTDDPDIAAKAILYSGSYMLYAQHRARPGLEYFEKYRGRIPNFSLRISNLTAAVGRPQIALLAERSEVWNDRYRRLVDGLGKIQNIRIPPRPPKEQYVMSSIQFSVKGLSAAEMERFLEACATRGVFVKWFGRAQPVGFTSVHEHWEYVTEKQSLPQSARVLSEVCDMRIPLALPLDSCDMIVAVIRHCLENYAKPA